MWLCVLVWNEWTSFRKKNKKKTRVVPHHGFFNHGEKVRAALFAREKKLDPSRHGLKPSQAPVAGCGVGGARGEGVEQQPQSARVTPFTLHGASAGAPRQRGFVVPVAAYPKVGEITAHLGDVNRRRRRRAGRRRRRRRRMSAAPASHGPHRRERLDQLLRTSPHGRPLTPQEVMGPTGYGSNRLWAQQVMGPTCHGPDMSWTQHVMGPTCYGPDMLWAQHVMGPTGYGFDRLWAAAFTRLFAVSSLAAAAGVVLDPVLNHAYHTAASE